MKKKNKSMGLTCDSEILKKLILENPGLPLLILAGENAYYNTDYAYNICSTIKCEIGEYLDYIDSVDEETLFTDRGSYGEEVRNFCEDKYAYEVSEEEMEALVAELMWESDPCWEDCIIIRIEN